MEDDQFSNSTQSNAEENLPEISESSGRNFVPTNFRPSRVWPEMSFPHPPTPSFSRITPLYSSKPQGSATSLGRLPGIPPKHELTFPSVLHLLLGAACVCCSIRLRFLRSFVSLVPLAFIWQLNLAIGPW